MDASRWIASFERAARINMWHGEQRNLCFSQFVCEDVLTWLTEQFEYCEQVNWNILKAHFLRQYVTTNHMMQKRLELNTIHQDKGENVRSYFSRVIDLIESQNENTSDAWRVETVLRGLNDKLRDKVLSTGSYPIEYSQLFKRLKIAEEMIEAN